MLERTDAITNEVLETITFILAYPALKLGHNKAFLHPFTFIRHPVLWHYVVLTLTVSQNNSQRKIHACICLSSSTNVSQWYIYIYMSEHVTHIPCLSSMTSCLRFFISTDRFSTILSIKVSKTSDLFWDVIFVRQIGQVFSFFCHSTMQEWQKVWAQFSVVACEHYKGNPYKEEMPNNETDYDRITKLFRCNNDAYIFWTTCVVRQFSEPKASQKSWIHLDRKIGCLPHEVSLWRFRWLAEPTTVQGTHITIS